MIRYTLVADGSSDQALLPIIDHTINHNFPHLAFSGSAATSLPTPRHGLGARIQAALRLYPCEVVFVHRDSEAQPSDNRFEEIAAACQNINIKFVPIVPIRMTEAWLLISEKAIRRAAGNPSGTNGLNIPRITGIEGVPNPKETLIAALIEAANLGARRRASFDVNARRRRVAECIEEYADLRLLSSYRRFENDVISALTI